MDLTDELRDDNYLDRIALLIESRLDKGLLPPRSAGLLRIYAVLALAVGPSIRDEDVHNAWVAWMRSSDPDHPALQPFDDLDDETARIDRPFCEAIRAVAHELENETARHNHAPLGRGGDP